MLKRTLVLSGLLLSVNANAGLKEDVKTLQDKVEELEFSNYSNFFKWSGSLENRVDVAKREDKLNKITGNSSYLSSQLHINMESRPSDRLSFFGRLSMRKYWNDGSFDAASTGGHGEDSVFTTWSEGRGHGTSVPYVERAFANYNILNNLVFSIGRLPTIDGMPKHITKGKSALGSYPTLAFSAILDGMALTHVSMNGALKTRIVYTPLQYVNYGANPTSTSAANPTNSYGTDGVSIKKLNNMYAVMADYSKSSLSFARSMNIIAQMTVIDGAFFGTKSTSNLELTNKRYTLFTEFNGIAKTGFNFAFQYAISKTESKGAFNSLGVYCTSTVSCSESGNQLVATLSYDWMKTRFGYEYISLDKKSFAYDTSPLDAINIYGTGGSTAHHFFVNHKFDNNLTMNVGYQLQEVEETYINSVFTAGTKADIERSNFYTSITASF